MFKTFEQAEYEHYTIEIDLDNIVLKSPAILDKSNEGKNNSNKKCNSVNKVIADAEKVHKDFFLKIFFKKI